MGEVYRGGRPFRLIGEPLHAFLLVVVLAGPAGAQAPTGTIVGVVTDASGAALAGMNVAITNSQTSQSRIVNTSVEGQYGAELLPPGVYRVSVEAAGFKRLERSAAVDAGTTTTVDLKLELGDVNETVTVRAAVPLLHSDHHQVSGVVHREQIDHLPLNGRNFLELAKLEPGFTNPARLSDNRVFVSSLGSGLQTIPRIGFTRVTVDGASISTPGTAGVLLQVSQDVVQEFQVSSVNFDQATSLTSNGAINIVTRSGGNEYHGSGFALYRDHRLAAYPALRRDPLNPDPFFQRGQFGFDVGGPLRSDRISFFGSYERHDQRGVVASQPRTPDFARLGGIFATPYLGHQSNVRFDGRLNERHHAFVRYTHDSNRLFATAGSPSTLPSGWAHRTNRIGQGLGALTSVLSSTLVNDVRFSYFFFSTLQNPATSADCDCFGLGAPPITIQDVGATFFGLGTADRFLFTGRRYQLSDNLVWQKGSHRVRFGFDWERITNTTTEDRQPIRLTLWAPARVRQLNPTIPLPATFNTIHDILQLPLQNVEISLGSGVALWRDFQEQRVADFYRVYASDTWRASRRLTVTSGLSWSYEPNALNHDLTKPAMLVPILGPTGLNAPKPQVASISPTVGFAWTPTEDAKTVVRGGIGRYFDPAVTTNSNSLTNERFLLSPLGTGRISVPGSGILCQGMTLDFRQQPTTLTGAQLLEILPACRAELLRSRNPDNRDFTYRNLDLAKSGQSLYDPSYRTPDSVHLSWGVQRDLGRSTVLSADVVWKRFRHTFINGIDYNRWGSADGPVIPRCTDAQRTDVTEVCSNGSLYFDTTIGRARYTGLLVRAEHRFSGRAQFLVSYALGSYVGTNGTGTGTTEASAGRVFGFNNDDWFENYGPLPTDRRHILNLSGFVQLPWRLQAAVAVSAYSPTPMSPYVSGVDFNGDGTLNDLLPGTTINQFGRSLDETDLAQLVERYNREFAGRPTPGGQTAPRVTLPEHYSFDDSFFTQDLRITRSFALGVRSARLVVFADVFNVFNTANHVQYGSNLADPSSFGQPGARFNQVFGSGGPRAFQLGAKLSL